ncbi:MAG: hypothetical protein AAF721_06710 [Myxococcota bacterium]
MTATRNLAPNGSFALLAAVFCVVAAGCYDRLPGAPPEGSSGEATSTGAGASEADSTPLPTGADSTSPPTGDTTAAGSTCPAAVFDNSQFDMSCFQ